MNSILLALIYLNAVQPNTTTQPVSARTTPISTPVTVEYYYRIRWGGMKEFRALYAKNHQPILDALKAQGFITDIKSTSPYNHMAGEERWDWRVTITYRSAEDAVGEGTGYTAATEAIGKRLFPDKAKFDAEEGRRFSLVDEHWDVIVTPE
jgi:hypothetical protein